MLFEKIGNIHRGRPRYFKVVRHDYTDFFSGEIHYDIGETVRHPDGSFFTHVSSMSGRMRWEKFPGYYLSVTTDPREVPGLLWDYDYVPRLLEVKPTTPVWQPNKKRYPNKRACLELEVIQQHPIWNIFGPNGREVLDTAVRINKLDHREQIWIFRSCLASEPFIELKNLRPPLPARSTHGTLYALDLGPDFYIKRFCFPDLVHGLSLKYENKEIYQLASETLASISDNFPWFFDKLPRPS